MDAQVNPDDPFEALPSKAKLKAAEKKAKAKAKSKGKAKQVADEGNSVASDPDAAFIQFMADVQVIDRDIDSMTGRRKNRFKQAKSEAVDTKAAVLVMKEMRLTGDEIIDRENATNRYRELVGLPYHRQLALESGATKEKDVLEIAEAEGKRCAYRGGRESQNPHDSGLPAGQAWLRGFGDASAIIGSLVKPATRTRLLGSARE